MNSAAELRAEARRLREAVNTLTDPAAKQELAARALELAQRAEALDLQETPEILRMNIARYRSMLKAGLADEEQKRIVEEMLADAERMLATAKVTR